MQIIIDKKKINLKYANTFQLRLCGLIGKRNINYGIIFPNCNSIHTFFMKEEIDILMLDENYQIKYIFKDFKINIRRQESSVISREMFLNLLYLPCTFTPMEFCFET